MTPYQQALVFASIQVEGFHAWPKAPDECEWLRARHRHQFHIKVFVPVDQDRQVEFILLSREIWRFLTSRFGNPCEFGSMSCEAIAYMLLHQFNAHQVDVSEDGENGAVVLR